MKARQEAELVQHRGGVVEMDMSDNDDASDDVVEVSSSGNKRRRTKQDSVPSTNQTLESMLSTAAGTVIHWC